MQPSPLTTSGICGEPCGRVVGGGRGGEEGSGGRAGPLPAPSPLSAGCPPSAGGLRGARLSRACSFWMGAAGLGRVWGVGRGEGRLGWGGGRDWMGGSAGRRDKAKRGTITKENTKKKKKPRTHTKKSRKKPEIKARELSSKGGGRRKRRGADADVWFSLGQGSHAFKAPAPGSSLSRASEFIPQGIGTQVSISRDWRKIWEAGLYRGGSSLPPITSHPLTPHQDFAERNGFCTRSFFIIKLTVSIPSSRPRLLPGKATPLSFGIPGGSPEPAGRCAGAAGARPQNVRLPRSAPPPEPRACAVGPGSGAGAGGNRPAAVRRCAREGGGARGGGAPSAVGASESGSP